MTSFPSYNPNDRTVWKVRVNKRKPGPDGQPDRFYGYTTNDGLQSLFCVRTSDGTVRYASVLDDIEWLEQLREA